jgi:hypothetical protein
MLAGSALATHRTSSGGQVFGCDGGLCATASVSAIWDVVQGHSEGQTYWAVSKLWLYSYISNARNTASVLGVSPISGHFAQALNSSGVVLKTIYLTQRSSCGQSFFVGIDDLSYNACASYVELPLSTTTLRLITKVEDPFVFGAGWNKTWNASLN